MMNTCEKCGKDSPDESEFCISCGTRFCAELHQLLAENGLDAYFGVFRRNHILTPDEVALLQESNFDELGIAAIGDRTRLKKVINKLRGHESVEIDDPPLPATATPQTEVQSVAPALESQALSPASAFSWYLDGWRNWLNFRGRSRRKAYWMFALFNFIASVLAGVLDGIFGFGRDGGYGLFNGLYSLAALLPGLSLAVRRLHDTGRSGWWLLLVLVPFLGWLVILVFLVLDSQPGYNEYGPNPKEMY
jgi:uncharacterized membrane protein YhaH (DUF805 family)